MSEIGKSRRLARMFNVRSGRMLCVAFDHGMQVGTIPGNEEPERVLEALAEAGVDAVILNPGMMTRHGHRLKGGPAVILRIDQTTMWREGTQTAYPDTHQRLVATVEDAVSLGAEAVITYLFTCNNVPEEESRSFEIAGQVASDCRKWGMAHVVEAMAARGGFVRHDDPEVISMNCRIAGELGADIIKTDWCDDRARFAAIATQSLAPVAVAGGSTLPDLASVEGFASAAIDAGARGLMFGRNIFGRPDMASTLKRLSSVVHG